MENQHLGDSMEMPKSHLTHLKSSVGPQILRSQFPTDAYPSGNPNPSSLRHPSRHPSRFIPSHQVPAGGIHDS